MKRIGGGVVVALGLAAILSGCAMTSVREHPDFASGKRKIQVVAILPAEVEYRHLVFTGENERDPEREKSIASDIESGMVAALKSRGYTAKLDVVDKARSGDKEFSFQLEQFRSAYVQAAKELYARAMVPESESTRFKVGVGPLANALAGTAGADALIIANYQGFDKSSGLMAKEITSSVLLGALTGVYYAPAKSGGRVELSLIDGVSGDVLWSNVFGGTLSVGNTLSSAMARLPVVAGTGETRVASDKPASTVAVTAAAEVPPAAGTAPAVAANPVHDTKAASSPVPAKQAQPAEAAP